MEWELAGGVENLSTIISGLWSGFCEGEIALIDFVIQSPVWDWIVIKDSSKSIEDQSS